MIITGLIGGARRARNVASGWFRVNTTVLGSGAAMLLMSPLMRPTAPLGPSSLSARSNDHFTACAFMGEPSVKVTFFRRWNV